ncbi:MAG: YicC/YloC family endoribonuclease [Lacipirellulaceae bacterium]
MLLSMTGFGEGRATSPTIAALSEVRSINNRHLKISYRSTDGYHGLESEVEALVRERISRGTVQVNLRVERRASAADYRLNADVLAAYQAQLAQLDPSGAAPPLERLLTLPGVVSTPDASAADPEADWPTLRESLLAALDALQAMRQREGSALSNDLLANCAEVALLLGGVEERAPLVADSYRVRLHERVGQAMEKLGVTIEAPDLAREVALFIDRSDISEETVRLRSHLEQFHETIAHGENAGRKLEFIAQEMGREVNTIGSKANDTEVSRRVVDMKAALERVREQVQNVE